MFFLREKNRISSGRTASKVLSNCELLFSRIPSFQCCGSFVLRSRLKNSFFKMFGWPNAIMKYMVFRFRSETILQIFPGNRFRESGPKNLKPYLKMETIALEKIGQELRGNRYTHPFSWIEKIDFETFLNLMGIVVLPMARAQHAWRRIIQSGARYTTRVLNVHLKIHRRDVAMVKLRGYHR